MKLVRLMTLCLDWSGNGHEVRDVHLEVGPALVRSWPVEGGPDSNNLKLLLTGEIVLQRKPAIDDTFLMKAPEHERLVLERALEFVANALAVSHRSSRQLMSANPFLAYMPENLTELAWLNGLRGIAEDFTAVVDPAPTLAFSSENLACFATRPDGLALLTEALASRHKGNQYRDLVRFFECAFALPAGKLCKKLAQFLHGSNLGYTRDEVNTWLRLRNGAAHGDRRKTERIVLEFHVRRYIPRMLQAAYDVLMNKQCWRSPSSQRQNFWHPPTATADPFFGLKMSGVTKPDLGAVLYDGFQSYPVDLTLQMKAVPPGMWVGPEREYKQA